VNFDATQGTPEVIKTSFNVSSVVQYGSYSGFTVNYATPISASGATVMTCRTGGGANGAGSGGGLPQIYGTNGSSNVLTANSATVYIYNTLTGYSFPDIVCVVSFSN
jgi:hypothetical protein